VEAIELAIAALKDEVESDNADKIKAGIQNVTEAAMKLGEAIYKAAQEEGDDDVAEAADSTGGGSNDDDDIVDAEFEDLDDDNKRAS
jgi:molecular chaperone DnaK